MGSGKWWHKLATPSTNRLGPLGFVLGMARQNCPSPLPVATLLFSVLAQWELARVCLLGRESHPTNIKCKHNLNHHPYIYSVNALWHLVLHVPVKMSISGFSTMDRNEIKATIVVNMLKRVICIEKLLYLLQECKCGLCSCMYLGVWVGARKDFQMDLFSVEGCYYGSLHNIR